ncbi:MAG: hypothetical protein WC389_19285, partial [Lutibacter sp.]
MYFDLAVPFDLDSFFTKRVVAYTRPFYETKGSYTVEKDGKLFIVLNALGISKEDLTVEVENDQCYSGWQVLKVKGSTQNDVIDKNFSLTWSYSSPKPITKIEKTVKDGLVTLEVTFDEPVKPNVKILDK